MDEHHHLHHNYHHRHRHLDIIFIKILTASQLAWQTFNQGAGQYERHDGGGISYFCRTQVRSLPCLVSRRPFLILFKLLHGLVRINRWISLNCYTDLSKLTHGFLQVVTWIRES